MNLIIFGGKSKKKKNSVADVFTFLLTNTRFLKLVFLIFYIFYLIFPIIFFTFLINFYHSFWNCTRAIIILWSVSIQMREPEQLMIQLRSGFWGEMKIDGHFWFNSKASHQLYLMNLLLIVCFSAKLNKLKS